MFRFLELSTACHVSAACGRTDGRGGGAHTLQAGLDQIERVDEQGREEAGAEARDGLDDHGREGATASLAGGGGVGVGHFCRGCVAWDRRDSGCWNCVVAQDEGRWRARTRCDADEVWREQWRRRGIIAVFGSIESGGGRRGTAGGGQCRGCGCGGRGRRRERRFFCLGPAAAASSPDRHPHIHTHSTTTSVQQTALKLHKSYTTLTPSMLLSLQHHSCSA